MSLFSKLFGGGSSSGASQPETKSEEYEGFTITPAPAKDGGEYRIGATIEKEIGGEMKSHTLIRADTLGSFDAACEASAAKARQMIDQMGDRVFNT